MKRRAFGWLLLALAVARLEAGDTSWLHRGTPEELERALGACRSSFCESPTYEGAWKLARIAQLYATVVPDREPDWRRALLEEGRDAAREAVALNPEGVEGHFYLSACLGSLAELSGPFRALAAVREIEREARRAVEIDPGFAKGSPLLALARLYHVAPAILSVGDARRAEIYYRRALEYGPDHRTLLRFFAEFLVERHRPDEALPLVRQGLAIPYDPEDRLLEDREIRALGEMLRSLEQPG